MLNLSYYEHWKTENNTLIIIFGLSVFIVT